MGDKIKAAIEILAEGDDPGKHTDTSGDTVFCFVIKGTEALNEGRVDEMDIEWAAAGRKIQVTYLPIVMMPIICAAIDKDTSNKTERSIAKLAISEALRRKGYEDLQGETTEGLKEGATGMLGSIKDLIKAIK